MRSRARAAASPARGRGGSLGAAAGVLVPLRAGRVRAAALSAQPGRERSGDGAGEGARSGKLSVASVRAGVSEGLRPDLSRAAGWSSVGNRIKVMENRARLLRLPLCSEAWACSQLFLGSKPQVAFPGLRKILKAEGK